MSYREEVSPFSIGMLSAGTSHKIKYIYLLQIYKLCVGGKKHNISIWRR